MKLFDGNEIVSRAVGSLNKPAVYVVNHDADEKVFMRFVREVNKRYDAKECRSLIDDTFNEGLVVFDEVDDAVKFFDIFTLEPIASSGLMAFMYDTFGNEVDCNFL